MAPTLAAVRQWVVRRQQVVHAVGAFALGLALYLSRFPMVVTVENPVIPMSDPARLLPLAVACAAQLLRYRAPVLGLVIGIAAVAAEVPSGVSLAVLIVFCDLLYCATLYGSRRVNRVIVGSVGVLIVTAVLVSVLLTHDWREAMLTMLQLCTIPLIPVWWGMNVRQQRQAAEAERARADQLARIAELDRKAAVTDERSRMARDLHDVIAGHLSAIAIQSEAALSMVDGVPDTTRNVLRSVRENSVASLTEMRAMIGLLRSDVDHSGPAARDDATAPPRLRDIGLLVDSASAAGLEVSTSTEIGGELPAAVDLSAYRIVQEALTNAVKHAPGARVDVTIDRRGRSLVVEVANDNGATAGRDPAGGRDSGKGLLTMRERAQAVGGTLAAGPDERGWRVRAELPLDGAAAAPAAMPATTPPTTPPTTPATTGEAGERR